MRRTLCALGITMALAVTGFAPAMAAGNPQRPNGPVVPVLPSENGGDNGWGNCGHNSSGGNPPSGDTRHGNGGYKKGDGCGGDQTDPTDPTDPGDGGPIAT